MKEICSLVSSFQIFQNNKVKFNVCTFLNNIKYHILSNKSNMMCECYTRSHHHKYYYIIGAILFLSLLIFTPHYMQHLKMKCLVIVHGCGLIKKVHMMCPSKASHFECLKQTSSVLKLGFRCLVTQASKGVWLWRGHLTASFHRMNRQGKKIVRCEDKW